MWTGRTGADVLNAHLLCSDNKVSVDEWKHMWYTSMGNDEDLAWQQLYLDYVFRLFDTSGIVHVLTFTPLTHSCSRRCHRPIRVHRVYGILRHRQKARDMGV
jgi:hypothetical protein